jgi:uncharacterized damage-inducible protein DinB
MSAARVLQLFYDGWADHQRLVLAAIEHLSQEQLALRTAPDEMAIWQIASHMAGSRAYWFHDILGEGDPAVRDMFRVASTTVPNLSLDDAGWEDDETHPRTAAEIVDAFHQTWGVVEGCLDRWTPEDLTVELPQGSSARRTTRGWVIWHLMEHEAHHGGAISLVLGTNGLPGLAM